MKSCIYNTLPEKHVYHWIRSQISRYIFMCAYMYTFWSPKGVTYCYSGLLICTVYLLGGWYWSKAILPAVSIFFFLVQVSSTLTSPTTSYIVYLSLYTKLNLHLRTLTCIHNLHVSLYTKLNWYKYSVLSTSIKEDWEWWNCSEQFDSRLFIWGRLSYCVHDHLTLSTCMTFHT